MIVDEVKVYLKAGRGGEANTSFLRLSNRKFIGGGGDGGKGGDIILKTSSHFYDLSKFLVKRTFIALNGERGKSNNKKGKNAQDLIISLPVGTQIKDLENNLIVDLVKEDEEFLICRGGAGGKGNFKKMYSLPPKEGEEKHIILDFYIPNDIAIVGFPNSGKTTLFNKLTGKSFKVAEYPFTTTHCAVAKMETDFGSFSVLDTPPLRLDISQKGLNKFLKHILRSKIILFLSENLLNYTDEFSLIKKEILKLNSNLLENKKKFYLLTKIDKIHKMPADKEVILISAQNNIGIETLKKKIISYLTKK